MNRSDNGGKPQIKFYHLDTNKKFHRIDFLFFRYFRKFFTLELGDPPSDLAKSAPGEASGTPWTLRTAFGHVLDAF